MRNFRSASNSSPATWLHQAEYRWPDSGWLRGLRPYHAHACSMPLEALLNLPTWDHLRFGLEKDHHRHEASLIHSVWPCAAADRARCAAGGAAEGRPGQEQPRARGGHGAAGRDCRSSKFPHRQNGPWRAHSRAAAAGRACQRHHRTGRPLICTVSIAIHTGAQPLACLSKLVSGIIAQAGLHDLAESALQCAQARSRSNA